MDFFTFHIKLFFFEMSFFLVDTELDGEDGYYDEEEDDSNISAAQLMGHTGKHSTVTWAQFLETS